jgi:hypothetical protein
MEDVPAETTAHFSSELDESDPPLLLLKSLKEWRAENTFFHKIKKLELKNREELVIDMNMINSFRLNDDEEFTTDDEAIVLIILYKIIHSCDQKKIVKLDLSRIANLLVMDSSLVKEFLNVALPRLTNLKYLSLNSVQLWGDSLRHLLMNYANESVNLEVIDVRNCMMDEEIRNYFAKLNLNKNRNVQVLMNNSVIFCRTPHHADSLPHCR